MYSAGKAALSGAAKTGGRVFWSGEGAMDAAMNYAKANGGTTLEMTSVRVPVVNYQRVQWLGNRDNPVLKSKR